MPFCSNPSDAWPNFPPRNSTRSPLACSTQRPSILRAAKRFGECWICWRASGQSLDPSEQKLAEELEIQAVDQVELYEDVVPALSELKGMGIQLFLASSLSGAAVSRFLERFPVREFFSAIWDRGQRRRG